MRTYIADIKTLDDGSDVTIKGWVQETRKIKNLMFIIMRDNTGSIQVTAKKDSMKNYDQLYDITRESVISVYGTLNKKSISKSGMEIQGIEIEILSIADTPLPLGVIDRVSADFDTRLNNRFLDLRKPEHLLIFQFESQLLFGIREFMNKENFIEVHTPKIVAAATEGGADLFRVEYFEKNAFLNQSPQLYKEILIASGFDKVFEVGPAFRAEKENTVRHLNEFTSIDMEAAFIDDKKAMEYLENAISYAVNRNIDLMHTKLEEYGYHLEKIETPFPRISYEDGIKYLNDHGLKLNFGDDFSPEANKILAEKFNGFYFITGWPSDMRPFYTHPDTNPALTKSFDLQLNDIEVTSGAQRIHNYKMLEDNFMKKGLNKNDFEFYEKAFKFGMPPHAGWGLGLERLVMNLLHLNNVRESTLFPRDRTRLSP
ncbi:aspartate--tRNA(Asn) ligase [Ferroplasma acidiphilum]|jgi:aspartyl-tRNA synthetase|uniref:Aspartate--tRNA(Asp) ligase n=1 Tax=Ferroplasma acidiphilum TaxID=74969 RepID=A0A1V0N225_9ARCH|nr:aspartate--tRNA(Asn) ligase [Ferroplasma acidiphilum]ARD84202.1 aspartyl-tRNA synthetase [Ferroplasma acidiphilum]NOL60474.1 aspartate--tRNA(Asn) ligase [Ferroplasma acidiphilum]WMT53108.1 MAG: aspartate--tRNA(Asn) ligase [Ferroplasma acidiphilum]